MFPRNHLYVLLTYILVLASTALLPFAFYFWFGFDQFTTVIYTNIIAFFFGAIIISILLRHDLYKEKINHPLSAGMIIIWSLAGILLAWFGQGIAVMIEMHFLKITPGSENTDLIVKLTRMNPLFLILPALIGPIIEEFVFRKVLFGALQRKMNVYFAAIISSFVFAIFHLEITHLLIYFVMGIIFTFLYAKTRRIIVPIIVHMSLNTISVTMQLLIDPEKLEQMRQQLSTFIFGG